MVSCFRAPIVFLVALIGGCASIPEPISKGPVTIERPDSKQIENIVGKTVRWGGKILKSESTQEETCFEILGFLLDRSGEPEESDSSAGRFFACTDGFYDPAIYSVGRKITIVGEVIEITTAKIGKYDYRYPKIKIDSLYLWPRPYVFQNRFVQPWPWDWPYRGNYRDHYFPSWPFGWY